MVPVSGGSGPAPRGCPNPVSIKALLFGQAAEKCGLCRQPRAATHSALGWGSCFCCARVLGLPWSYLPSFRVCGHGRVWRYLRVCAASNAARSSASAVTSIPECCFRTLGFFLCSSQFSVIFSCGPGLLCWGAAQEGLSPGSPHEPIGSLCSPKLGSCRERSWVILMIFYFTDISVEITPVDFRGRLLGVQMLMPAGLGCFLCPICGRELRCVRGGL